MFSCVLTKRVCVISVCNRECVFLVCNKGCVTKVVCVLSVDGTNVVCAHQAGFLELL